MTYARPQWTGRRGGFSDDPLLDPSQCPSCLHYHAAAYVGCNGLREPSEERCGAWIGETHCDRPAKHIGAHEALSEHLRITWEVV